jgi:hypothetical protein
MIDHYLAYTLIDISETSALQIQNYNSLVQVLQLRANVDNVDEGMKGNQDLIEYDFGTNFGGNQNVWTMSFTTEQQNLFANRNGEFGGLIDDIHNVPVITKLMESVKIDPKVFDSINPDTKNIYFIKQQY